ncbi:MAG: ribosome maturation factor RimM [Nocardioidaceae bacterium]|nr:ribosome maturation factor RimM [Nocardioidaceae bacterium]
MGAVSVEDYLVVGRIGKPHGLKGEVSVEPRTDEPERRFAAGASLQVERPRPGAGGTLTVRASRWHSGRLLVTFEEITDRNAAEAARGTVLVVPVDPDEQPEDPEEFYDHQLVGLAVESPDGTRLATVTRVEHTGAQDLLVLDVDGRSVLFPFVQALVPLVDVRGGRVVVDDRPGLLAEEAP